MAKAWREYVKQEFMKADNEFIEKMPINSIDLSTFGLISEATSFALVELENEIHLRPLASGLSSLKSDIQNSSRPGGGFDVDSAVGVLTQFGEEWEEKIKENNKWDKMVELAKEEDQIMAQSDFEQETESKTSLLDRVKGIFR